MRKAIDSVGRKPIYVRAHGFTPPRCTCARRDPRTGAPLRDPGCKAFQHG